MMRAEEALIRALDPQEKIPRQWLEAYDLSLEEVNQDAKAIVELAYYLREINGHSLLLLPFDHTLEAEVFGATTYYDPDYGSRVQTPLYTEGTYIQKIDLKSQRLLSTLQAVEEVKSSPYSLCFNLTGPATVMNMLISQKLFVKGLKRPEQLASFLSILEEGLIAWINLILVQEVEIISYGDPTGDATIVGPNFFKEIVGRSNLSILKTIYPNLRPSGTVFHIHPALAKSLIASNLMRIEKIWIPKLSFPESLLEMKGDEGLFVSRLDADEIVELVFNDEEATTGEG